MKITSLLVIFCFLCIGFMNSCKDDDKSTSKFSIRLTDAPGDYAEVNIDIQNVQIHTSDTSDEKGWKDLALVNPGVYNLMDFVNGKDTLLASDELPAGQVSQIRLILGDNNSLRLKDNTLVTDFKIPSAQQSGIKLNIHAEIKEGIAYVLNMDFDAAKSVVEKGNGKYSLKPTIRTFLTATSGAVKGIVSPAGAQPNVQAILGSDTVTTYADSTGRFLLRGVNAGTYKIVFVASGYQELTKENVEVTTGNVTDLGTITLTAE